MGPAWNATWNANRNVRTCGVLLATLAASAAAHASITPIGQFTGQYQESFDNLNFNWTSGSVPVFSGLASVRERSNGSLIVTNAWSFFGVTNPKEGDRFLGSPSSWIEYSFNSPLASFGGFFTTNSSIADGQVEFFLNGQLLSTQPLAAPKNGVWAWNGWTSPTGFDAVRVTSNYASGGFLMQDALQATSIPVPGSLAAAGLVLLAGLRRRRS